MAPKCEKLGGNSITWDSGHLWLDDYCSSKPIQSISNFPSLLPQNKDSIKTMYTYFYVTNLCVNNNMNTATYLLRNEVPHVGKRVVFKHVDMQQVLW